MKMEVRKKDIIWSFFNYGMNVVSNMLTIMFAVVFLPQEELGMWYTFLSLGAIVQLVDFGFLPCITRNISFAWSGATELKKDGIPPKNQSTHINYDLLRVIIGSSRYIYTVMAIVVLVLGGTVGGAYIVSLVDAANITKYLWAWILYAMSLVLNIYFGYWTGCLQGIGAIKENNQAKVISYICMIVTTILCLMMSFGLIAMALGNLVMGIVYRLLAKRHFLNHPNIQGKDVLVNEGVDKSQVINIIKIMWPNTWKMGLTSLATYFITQGNTLLCSAFLGLEATATYGVSLQICNAIITIAKILMTVYQPKLVELNLLGDKKEITKLMSMIIVTYWIIVIGCGIGLVTFGLPIISMIKKDTVLPVSIFCFMLLYLALEGNHSCFTVYLTTENQIPFFKAGIISAFGVFILSYILVSCTELEVWGLMLGQSITQLLYNNWKWPLVVHKELSVNPIQMIGIGLSELFINMKRQFIKKTV